MDDERWHEEDHGIQRSSRGWVLLRHSGIPDMDDEVVDYHIVPVGDSGRHWTLVGCPCSPRVIRILEDGLVYCHESYDDREQSPDPLISALGDLLP